MSLKERNNEEKKKVLKSFLFKAGNGIRGVERARGLGNVNKKKNLPPLRQIFRENKEGGGVS